MIRFRRSLLVAVGALALSTVGADDPAAKPIDFKLSDSTGKLHALSSYQNRFVVLEWFDPDCPLSLRHHQDGRITRVARKYFKSDVVWLGVVSQSKRSAREMEDFRKKLDIPYPILNDVDGTLARTLGVRTTLHMFVTRNGRKLYEGAIDNDPKGNKKDPINFVARALDELLRGKPVTVTYKKPYGSSIRRAVLKE